MTPEAERQIRQYRGDLIQSLNLMVDRAMRNYKCEYESPESSVGACDAEPCGGKVVAVDLETEQHRCKKHLEAR